MLQYYYVVEHYNVFESQLTHAFTNVIILMVYCIQN